MYNNSSGANFSVAAWYREHQQADNAHLQYDVYLQWVHQKNRCMWNNDATMMNGELSNFSQAAYASGNLY